MTDIVDQYRIIASGAGWIDRRTRGRLVFEGADAASFLHAIVTNDVSGLAVGQGVYAALLTPQGRMIADLRLYRRDGGVFADVPSGRAAALAMHFDQAIFAEDVRVSDESASFAAVTIAGAEAPSVISTALDLDRAEIASLALWSHRPCGRGFVARTDDAKVSTFDVVVEAAAWTETLRRLEAAGATAVPAEIAEIFRIEAGRPAFGVDMTEETIPLEAGILERAISTTKGCYIGQEIIVRILHRGGGRVARRLVMLDIATSVNGIPAAGEVITDAGRDVGRLTSVAPSPIGTHAIALGYVHRDAAVVGKTFQVSGRSVTITAFAG